MPNYKKPSAKNCQIRHILFSQSISIIHQFDEVFSTCKKYLMMVWNMWKLPEGCLFLKYFFLRYAIDETLTFAFMRVRDIEIFSKTDFLNVYLFTGSYFIRFVGFSRLTIVFSKAWAEMYDRMKRRSIF